MNLKIYFGVTNTLFNELSLECRHLNKSSSANFSK